MIKVFCVSAIVLCLVSCSSESKMQDEAWKAVKDKLKAPSTAKIAEFKVYPVTNANEKKAYFLRQAYDLRWCFKLRSSIEKKGIGTSTDFGAIKIFGRSLEWNDFISEVRSAAPSQSDWLDKGAKSDWKQDGAFFPAYKTERKAVIEAIDRYINKIVSRETTRYQKQLNNIQVFNTFIHYDAQNSFGAMIRGIDHYFFVLENDHLRLIETDDDPVINSMLGVEDFK